MPLPGERVTVSILRRHIRSLELLFRWDDGAHKWVAQPAAFFETPGIEIDMGNMIGAMHKSESEQYPPGGGVPPVPGSDFCAADALRRMVAWGNTSRFVFTSAEFRDNAIAASFVVPASFARPFDQPGKFSMAEYDGGDGYEPWPRHVTLSLSACDFRAVDPMGANGPLAASFGKQATIDFNVVSASGMPALVPGRTYFANFRNFDPTVGNSNLSPTSKPAASFDFQWPHDAGQPTPTA